MTLAVALAFIIVSAVRHSTAVESCQALFTSDTNSGSTTSGVNGDAAQGICNVWTWVQVGIMGLLFVLVALSEVSTLARATRQAS